MNWKGSSNLYWIDVGGTQGCIEAILNCADLEASLWTSNKDSRSILTTTGCGRQSMALRVGDMRFQWTFKGPGGFRRMTRRRSCTAVPIRVSKRCKSPLTIGGRRWGVLSRLVPGRFRMAEPVQSIRGHRLGRLECRVTEAKWASIEISPCSSYVFVECFDTLRYKSAISIAVWAASAPLFPALPPARSSA